MLNSATARPVGLGIDIADHDTDERDLMKFLDRLAEEVTGKDASTFMWGADTTSAAMMAIAEDDPRRTLGAAMATVAASDCQRLVCKEAIPIQGGVGYTGESDVQLYVTGVETLEARCGRGRQYRGRVADRLGLIHPRDIKPSETVESERAPPPLAT